MKKTSQWLGMIGCALVAVLAISAFVSAQTPREKFVISAKAGGVNSVTGKVSVHGPGTSEWQMLTIKENLTTGDVVKTGVDGRVEMLLSPGSYLRVGENSEFELIDNNLDTLEVNLIRGTAIVEAAGAEDTELLITITTPEARMAIVRRGLYRVNVSPGDGTELIVRKGRVMLGDSHTKVKGGHKVTFARNMTPAIAKMTGVEKKDFDSLDAWSKERGQIVAKANQRIRDIEMRRMLAMNRQSWYGRTNGLWYYNQAFNCYTFIPFYPGWGSGYGLDYSLSIYGNYYWRGPHLFGVANGQISGNNNNNPGTINAGGGYTSTPSALPPRSGSPQAPQMMPRENPPPAAIQKVERLNDRMPQP